MTDSTTGLCDISGIFVCTKRQRTRKTGLQSNVRDWSEINQSTQTKWRIYVEISHVQMVIDFYTKVATLSPTQLLWGKSKTFCKQRSLEMLHISRRFSATRRGSQESKGMWELSKVDRKWKLIGLFLCTVDSLTTFTFLQFDEQNCEP